MLCFAVLMARLSVSETGFARIGAVLALVLLGRGIVPATDWPQYRGPATDGSSPDAIAITWATTSPTFVVVAEYVSHQRFQFLCHQPGPRLRDDLASGQQRQPARVLRRGGRDYRRQSLDYAH